MVVGDMEPGFSGVYADAPIGVALVGLDRRYLRVNRALCELLGYPERELVGKSPCELVHPEDRRKSAERAERLLSGGSEQSSLEERYLRKDGRVVWVLSSAAPVRDARREPGRFLIYYQGITGRKSLEEELRRGEERFRSLIQNSPDLISVLEADGTVRYDSPAIVHMLGYEPEERIGKNALDYIHPEDAGRARRAFDEAIKEPEGSTAVELRIRSKDGSWRYLESTCNNLLENPSVRGIVTDSRDVTGRKQAEEELRGSEKRNRAILEAYPDLMFRVSRNGEYLDFQTNEDDKLYVSREEIVGGNVRDTLPPEIAGGALRCLARAFETGRMQVYEYRLPVPAGLRDFEARLVPTGDDEALCIIRDVTQRKRVEAALQESEARFRTLFERSVDTLIVHDEKGRILDCNSEACRTLGYTREELLSLHIGDIATGLLSEEERKEREKRGGTLWQRVVRGEPDTFGVVHYGEHKRKDGTTFPIEVHVGGVDYGGRRLILASVRDITERREFEKRLRENEQRYRSLFEHNPDAVYSFDLEGNFLSANAACETLTGYPVEELLRMSFAPLVVPEDRERTLQRFEKAVRGEPQNYENTITHRDGHRVELNVTSLPVIIDGEIVGVYGIAKDITARKRVEKDLRSTSSRLSALIESLQAGILVEDETRRIRHVNQRFCEMFGIPAPPEALVGVDCAAARESSHLFARPKAFVGRIDEILEEKRAVTGEELCLADGRTFERDYVPIFVDEDYRGHLWHYRDISERKQAEEAHYRLAAIVESSDDAILGNTLEGIITSWNPGAEKLYGYSADEILGKHISILFPPERQSEVSRVLEGTGCRGEINSYETARIAKDGRRIHVSVTASPVRDSFGNIIGTSGILRDITGRKKAEEDLRRSEERYRAVFERTTDGIFLADFDTERILETNTALQDMLGYTSGELRGMSLYEVIAEDPESINRNTRRALEGEGFRIGERRYRRRDGSLVTVESSIASIPYGDKEVSCCIARDITERKALEEQLSHRAFHDTLTGLPNRLLFTERIEHALARARRQRNRVAVLFIDLDNFKDVNDNLGHDAGDQLLTTVAGVLRKTVRPGDTVARFGGDEFTVLLEEVADTRDAIQVAERIEEALRAPITIAGHELFVGVSIGITTSLSSQDRPERLLRHADLAMYRAKGAGKARHEVFTQDMEAISLKRLRLGSDLRRAVEQNEMRVYYQPKVHLGTNLQQQLRSSGNPAIVRTPRAMRVGEIVGMEALVRWEHPERGVIYPCEFISAAEETGLIRPIGHRVLEEACHQARAWREQYPGGPPLVMCVNLSARQFQHPGLAQDITRVLRETSLAPHCLQLEITESVLMKEAGSTLSILKELRKLGVSLAIDDFGTGYSSLSYLKRFPADHLKIDHSFVAEVGEDPENAAIVSGIITLAHTLGMQVIAEGVETADQAARLRRMGCDLAQGNYFSEPLSGEAAGELLARNRLSTASGATV